MIRRCTESDALAVNTLLTHPEMYDNETDDGSLPREEFDATAMLQCDAAYTIGWFEDCKLAAVATLRPWNTVTYEIHTCVSPEHRGQQAVSVGKETLQWMFNSTDCKKIVAIIPTFNKQAIVFVLMLGMEKEGMVRKSFLKNGTLWDQCILGIEKGG